MTDKEELTGTSRWFPYYKLRSLTTGLCVLQVILFLVSLGLGTEDWSPATCSLYQLGGVFAPDIQMTGQLQRLVLPVVLHANLLHLVVNLLFQLQVGFALEKYFGRIRFILIMLFSEILGNLYAGYFDRYGVGVGASTGLLGLLGSQAAVLAYNWKAEDEQRLEKITIYAVSVFIVYVLSSIWPHCTRMGHLIGLLCGVMLGFVLLPIHENRLKWWVLRLLSLAGLGGLSFWVIRQMLHNRAFYDCAFLQYVDRSGEEYKAGDYCELMCSQF